jgi:acyl-lipid Delta6-acetylenase / acyl-lipid (9-3)-desaturase
MADNDQTDPKPAEILHIHGEAYDVSRWARFHPGREILTHFFGRDATAAFEAFHGPLARRALKGLKVKQRPETCPTPESTQDVERDFDALRTSAQERGLFQSSKKYFYFRGAFIISLIAGGVTLLTLATSLWWVAALMLALAWQQCGWLAHDFLHHSVHGNRAVNDLVGIGFGGLILGFSTDWWKRKHNTHHALPNVMGSDEDIDTLPLLAFTERDLTRTGAFARHMVRMQVVTAVPVLALARINWVAQSFLWAIRAPDVRRRGLEIVSLIGHHAWSLGVLFLLPDWPTRIAFFLIAQLVSGLLTASVFLVGHNARPIYLREEAPGFYALQCNSTQNVRAPFGTRWFFGGLDHQIEHHLFPTMPRHNHVHIVKAVREICERHGITYTQRGFLEGLVDVLHVLARVSRATKTIS